jgi:hypothetical protein
MKYQEILHILPGHPDFTSQLRLTSLRSRPVSNKKSKTRASTPHTHTITHIPPPSLSNQTETGVIPASRQHEVCKALEGNDWQQVRASLESLVESVRLCPMAKRSRPLLTPNLVSYCVEGMGTRFISTVHGHRPYCTGLRWKRCD